MNEILCKLTGGHKYKDANLKVYEDKIRRRMLFSNACVKCGKEYHHSIPYDKLFTKTEIDLLGLNEQNEI